MDVLKLYGFLTSSGLKLYTCYVMSLRHSAALMVPQPFINFRKRALIIIIKSLPKKAYNLKTEEEYRYRYKHRLLTRKLLGMLPFEVLCPFFLQISPIKTWSFKKENILCVWAWKINARWWKLILYTVHSQ